MKKITTLALGIALSALLVSSAWAMMGGGSYGGYGQGMMGSGYGGYGQGMMGSGYGGYGSEMMGQGYGNGQGYCANYQGSQADGSTQNQSRFQTPRGAAIPQENR